jgi:hypothetical protein
MRILFSPKSGYWKGQQERPARDIWVSKWGRGETMHSRTTTTTPADEDIIIFF